MNRRIRKSTAKTRPRRFFETGQGLVEYALIIAMVALLAIGATAYLGGHINGTLSNVGTTAGGAVLGAGQSGPPGSSSSPSASATTPPSDYHNQQSCQAAGYIWHHVDGPDFCSNQPVSPSEFEEEGDCEGAGFHWIELPGPTNDYCSATPAATPTPTPVPTAPPMPTQPPAPTQTGHTVGASCGNWWENDHWHWDNPVWHPYTFDSTPSPGHWENGYWSGGWNCR